MMGVLGRYGKHGRTTLYIEDVETFYLKEDIPKGYMKRELPVSMTFSQDGRRERHMLLII